jgi:glycosyltransferase involved in cell wall biosynthesis
VVERLAPGGIETLVLDIARRGEGDLLFSLQGTREELARAWPAVGELSDRIEAFGRRPGIDLPLIPRLARALRRVRPCAVFLHHMGPLLYGGIAARLAAVPRLIYVEHDAWHYEQSRDRMLARLLLRGLGAQIVAASRQVSERLNSVVPGKDVTVVPPGIATDRFKPGDKATARRRLGLDPSWSIVGNIGRLQPVKGQRYLIEALEKLPQTAHVVFVGDGPLRATLEGLARDHGVAGRVHFLGHRDDVADIYPAFDVFCLSSLSEGLPRTLLEAQASGVPVVATQVGGIAEAVCPATGILVPPADPAALAAALSHALATPNPAASPRSFVVGEMSLDHTLRRYRHFAEA